VRSRYAVLDKRIPKKLKKELSEIPGIMLTRNLTTVFDAKNNEPVRSGPEEEGRVLVGKACQTVFALKQTGRDKTNRDFCTSG